MAEIVEITDPGDPRLADYRDLRDVELRKSREAEHGLFIAEGEKVVRRAADAGFSPRSLLMAPRWVEVLGDVLASTDAPCFVLSEELSEAVTGFHVHRGALAAFERPELPAMHDVLAEARSVLALEDLVDHAKGGVAETSTSGDRPMRIAVVEDLVDHANVGALFRNAAALGVQAVLLSPRCADPLYRRAIKVSMGAVLQVPWTRVDPWPEGLNELKRHGFVVAGMTLATDAIDLDQLAARADTNLALVFGTEGAGLTRRAAALADLRVRIPMDAGVDSLNVAAASAVAFYATRPRS